MEDEKKDKIKLEVEIKGDRFFYSWEIGSSKQSSSCLLGSDNFASFSKLVDVCNRSWQSDREGKELSLRLRLMAAADAGLVTREDFFKKLESLFKENGIKNGEVVMKIIDQIFKKEKGEE